MVTNLINGNSFLKSYLELNAELVKTIVIKSLTSCEVLNDYIRLKYGEAAVDKYNPNSWKYYLNISGEYHPIDTQMTVTSLDTLEEIVFNKANLALHTATAKAYEYGTRYYYSLLSKYPDQDQLILGILYPVNIDKAIEAEDGSILGYPKGLVEPQEITLIPSLEDYIKKYLVRWNVQAFGLSDTLYNTAQHAIMYLNLLPKLLNLRLERCKTYEAHSFHIREYLASHGRLDKYLPFMTLKQALYLYRNINYIDRNSGKVDQFKELVQKFLTDRRIPLSEYSIRHLASFDDRYYPEIIARRKPVNSQYNVPEKDYIEMHQLYDKETPLVYGNPLYYKNNSITDTYRFKTSISSAVQSKDLESSMVDYSDAVPDTLESVLMRQWCYMATKGLYNVVIRFRDPKTSETRTLYAKEAFIYMYYVSLKAIGIDIETIPVYFNLKVRKNPKPTLNDLLAVTSKKFKDFPVIAQNILDNQPNIYPCYSTSMFFELSSKIHSEAFKHWVLVSGTEDLYKRAEVANMVLRLYEDECIDFYTGDINVGAWLVANNLPEYDYTFDQAQELIASIFNNGTGLIIDSTKILKNIQRAMLEILTQLSSYSIQLIREINPSSIKPLNWAAIRIGDLKYKIKHTQYIPEGVYVEDIHGASADRVTIEEGNSKLLFTKHSIESSTYQLPIRMYVAKQLQDRRTRDVHFSSFRADLIYDAYNADISSNSKFTLFEYYLALSDEQKSQIKSIYN